MKPPTRLASAYSHVAVASQLPGAWALRRWAMALGFRAGPLTDSLASDTVFILGTGPSIATIGRQQWDHVAAHDSIGINYFGLHWFVPTWLAQESMTAGPEAKERQIHRLAMLSSYGSDRPVEVWRLLPQNRTELEVDPGFVGAPARTGHTAAISILLHLAAHDVAAFARVSAGVDRRRRVLAALYERGLTVNFRSSAVWAVWLARQAGYRKVVLCGIDLSGNRNFWDDDPSLIRSGLARWPGGAQVDGALHRTESGAVGTSAALVAMSDVFSVSRGPRLLLGTTGSRMDGRISDYDWP